MEKVIAVLKSYLGYLEKKSNSQLDSKSGNTGRNNYTRFGRDYEKYMGVKGFLAAYWCFMFISVCFVEAFGLEKAKKLLCGNLWAYCPYGMQAFKKKGQLHSKPKKGDLVFFIRNGVARHVGYVTKVSGNTFQTIEGNTSSSAGVVANGGCVARKSYTVNSNMKFGRPDYSIVAKNATTTKTTEIKATKLTKASLIRKLQKEIGVTVDGIFGSKTLAALPTLKEGSKGDCVELLQRGLDEVYNITVSGGADGIFGAGTEKAVQAFQKKNGLSVDGVVGKKTWSAFLD